MICTPEFSTTVINASKKSNFTSNNDTQIVCLGEASGCLNLFELMKDIDEKDAKEPVEILSPEKENLIIFWSSGTTGRRLKCF